MNMHRWGDPGVDWKGIGDAAEFIGDYLVRWGRIGVQDTKEKFGTVRVYCSLGWSQFHTITHSRYSYCQYPRWLWSLDCMLGSRVIIPLNWLVVPFHKFIYRRAYFLAVRKWPHLRGEILGGASYSELLEGL